MPNLLLNNGFIVGFVLSRVMLECKLTKPPARSVTFPFFQLLLYYDRGFTFRVLKGNTLSLLWLNGTVKTAPFTRVSALIES